MKRCMVAVDVQNFYRPSPGVVAQINQLSQTLPTAATLLKHNESAVPLSKMGKPVPMDTSVLVTTSTVFDKYGMLLPNDLIAWLRAQAPDEVLVTGGHTDANVLAAGIALFSYGFTPCIVPLLCYGNEWFRHSVTVKVWEMEIGKLYNSLAEFKFEGM